MAFAKVVFHHRGPRLGDPEVRANVVHHFMDIYGAHTAERVRFHILVQQFIGIQFWTVGRLLNQADICWNNQRFRSMPTSLIDLHHDEIVLEVLADVLQEEIHHGRVGRRQD